MKRVFPRKYLSRLPLTERLYNLPLIKAIYQRVFLLSVTEPQYYIELSNICNAECIFCSYPALRDGGKSLSNMTGAHFDRIVEFIERNPRSTIALTPTTGEVFINPHWQKYVQRILDLDFVKYVHFYTNAALLNENNRAKLLQLHGIKKLSMSFSTGGLDEDTYRLLFGKDLFHQVKSNINKFLGQLRDKGMNMHVSVDIKLPKGQTSSIADGRATYNQCGYKYAFIKTRQSFDDLGGLIEHHDLDVMAPAGEARHRKPCKYLDDVRFAANGEIWLCGCVISELPGVEDLRVGRIDDREPSQKLIKFQTTIQKNWTNQHAIPHNCRDCTWYIAR